MSEIISAAVKALNEKLDGEQIDGSVKFVLVDEGSILIDADGARASDADADCTLTASVETFRGLLEGEINPTTAFMSGQLTVEGDMGLAMKLGSLLA